MTKIGKEDRRPNCFQGAYILLDGGGGDGGGAQYTCVSVLEVGRWEMTNGGRGTDDEMVSAIHKGMSGRASLANGIS